MQANCRDAVYLSNPVFTTGDWVGIDKNWFQSGTRCAHELTAIQIENQFRMNCILCQTIWGAWRCIFSFCQYTPDIRKSPFVPESIESLATHACMHKSKTSTRVYQTGKGFFSVWDEHPGQVVLGHDGYPRALEGAWIWLNCRKQGH